MTCNACGQNEATIHLTEILNDQMIEVHLCEGCAEQKGSDFKTYFDFNKVIASLTDLGAEVTTEQTGKIVCPSCGMSYEDFARTGRLGCAVCYQSFEKVLIPLVKRLQREIRHTGKIPAQAPDEVKSREELRDLHERLQKCIGSESFEEAAKIRDQIRVLEEQEKKGKRKRKKT